MYQRFYRELAKLLFVITDVEGLMTRLEKNNLLYSIKRLLFEDRRTDEIEGAIASRAEAKDALNVFLDFIDDNYLLFDEKMRKASSIAAKELWLVYQETSKQEKRLVQQLVDRFKT
jgi:hypothetical protein